MRFPTLAPCCRASGARSRSPTAGPSPNTRARPLAPRDADDRACRKSRGRRCTATCASSLLVLWYEDVLADPERSDQGRWQAYLGVHAGSGRRGRDPGDRAPVAGRRPRLGRASRRGLSTFLALHLLPERFLLIEAQGPERTGGQRLHGPEAAARTCRWRRAAPLRRRGRRRAPG